MEYSESLINGGVTYEHQCHCCGNEKHQVKGAIRYAYVFIESLPFFPVGRSISLECTECLNVVEQEHIASSLYQRLKKSIFTIYHFAMKFVGVMLILFLSYQWWQSSIEVQKQTANIVNYPQVNDFYLLDFRHLSDELRPHEKYRIAKIVDITGDTISLVYGNFFYKRPTAFKDTISSGHVTSYSYFGKKRYDFKQQELSQLLANQTVIEAGRPYGNMLFGHYVINDTGYRVGAVYYPGEREYASGLAFEEATYLEGNFNSARDYFQKSAEMNFPLAQIRLAEYYLTGKTVEVSFDQALFWLERASKQSYKSAINKYTIVCKQTRGCDIDAFYTRLIDYGVNLTINE